MQSNDTPIRICARCGNPLTANQNAYCSLPCYRARTDDQRTTCETCGIVFHPNRKGQRVCSTKCITGRGTKRTPVMLTCKGCGNTFEAGTYAEKKKEYCSLACYHHSIENTIACERCGKHFQARSGNTHFCSRTCMRSGWNDVRGCLSCQKEFTPTRQNQTCCSRDCALAWRYAEERRLGTRQDHPEVICKTCSKVFQVFPSAAKRKDRPRLYCSTICKHAASRVDPTEMGERGREYMRRWRAQNPHKENEIQARRRAQKAASGCVDGLDKQTIVARDGAICYLCQIPIDLALTRYDPMSLTLDLLFRSRVEEVTLLITSSPRTARATYAKAR